MSGWRVFWLLAGLLSALFAGGLARFGGDEAGLRALVRFTARDSFALFLLVYTAGPLRHLWPTPATRWLARNRRYLGVSFAWAHGLHLVAIALLAILLGAAFESNPVTLLVGGFAYLLLAGMVITSFDRTARWLGPRRWKILHRTGLHTLWLVFALSFTPRALAEPGYAPVALLVWSAGLLRFAASRARAARPGAATLAEPG